MNSPGPPGKDVDNHNKHLAPRIFEKPRHEVNMTKRTRDDIEYSSSISDNPSSVPNAILETPSTQSESSVDERSKLYHIDLSGEVSAVNEVMRCSLPPHGQILSFSTYEEYEIHYNKAHVNRCLECRRNFPTQHYLDLHLRETHDPLVEVLKERGERTYACFVEDCDRKCSTAQKRRRHLIDKHSFPKIYDFNVVNDGIDQRGSLLKCGRHRRRSSAVHNLTDGTEKHLHPRDETNIVSNQEASHHLDSGSSSARGGPQEANTEASEMDGLVKAMSSLMFVPTSIRFGRGKGRGRGGFSKS